MPASARPSASWRRRSPTSWCAAATCGSTSSTPRRPTRCSHEMSAEATRAGRAGRARRGDLRAPRRLHALCRPGPRDRGRAAAAATCTADDAPGAARGLRARLRRAVRAPHPQCRDRDPELVGPGLDRGEAAGRAAARRRAVPRPCRSASAPVFDGRSGRTTEVPVYRREALAAGQRLRRARRSSPRTRPRPIFRPALPRISMPPAVSSWTARTREERMSQSNSVGLIDLQIMWNRLIAVVEEQAQTLMRTAFSPIVREAATSPPACSTCEGRMLAQAVTGTPGHVNSMAESVKHFLAPLPGRDDEAGRRLHHQRSVDGHRPSQRLRHHHALLPQAASWSACSPAPAISWTSAASASGRTRPTCSWKASTSRC